jgi:D-amino-acid dehydrogenase
MTGKSVVVVGGGVIGLCVAWYALKSGLDVTVLERGGASHDSCSLGNAGMIVPSHFVPLAAPGMVAMGLKMLPNPESPFGVRPRLSRELLDWGVKFWRASTPERVERAAPLLRDLNLLSRRGYEELNGELPGGFGLEQRGLLMLCKTDHALHEERRMAERAVALGVPAETLTPEEAARLDPNIRMDIAGAVYFPKDCHLAPGAVVAGLTEALRANGARIVWDTDVTGWRTDGDLLVAARTGAGKEFAAERFVLAGGAWTPTVGRSLGLYLPMQAGKGYSMTLARPRELPRLCSILTEARVAVTPMGGALRVGGTMELGGLDLSVNAARVRGIVRSVPRYFPTFREEDFAGEPVWSGLRPCSPDGLPYVGATRRYPNLVVATGHAMMGLSLGPVTGMLVADLLNDDTPRLDISALAPDRYAH